MFVLRTGKLISLSPEMSTRLQLKFHKATFSTIHNIFPPNFAVLLILNFLAVNMIKDFVCQRNCLLSSVTIV